MDESALGRDLLCKGLGWKIGDGTSVRVWEDLWLPGNDYFQPFVNKDIWADLKVEFFIDNLHHQWRRDKIEHIFHPIDVQRICDTSIQQDRGPIREYGFPLIRGIFRQGDIWVWF